MDTPRYVSWIPNVSGKLVFSLSDPFSYRYDRIVGDVFEKRFSDEEIKRRSHPQSIVISMLVDLRDYRSPIIESKYTRLIFVAEYKQNKLQGKLHFLDDLDNPGLSKSQKEIGFVKALKASESFDQAYKTVDDLVVFYQNADRRKLTTIEYKLKENGIVYLGYIEGAAKRDKENREIDIKQAYYFLKFIFHRDRFHPQANEEIVPVLPYSPQFDDKQYISKMIDSIGEYLSVVRKEKSGDYQGLQRLLGIATYVETLYTLSDTDERRKKHLERLEKSIRYECSLLPEIKPPTLFDFLQELKSWSIVIFAIITPLFVSEVVKLDENDFLPYFEIYAFGFALSLSIVYLTRAITANSIKACYLSKKGYDLYKAVLLKVKKNSLPSLGKNWFTSKLFPVIVDMEMSFRRTPLKKKRTVGAIVAFIAICIFVASMLFALRHVTVQYQHEDKSQNQNPALPHKVYDRNATLKQQVLYKVR